MAYKYSRGAFAASGSVTLEEGLNVTGSSALAAVTATTISGTTVQFTTVSASALGGAAVSNVSAQYLPSWDAGLGRFENSFISRTGFGKTIVSGALGLEVTGAFSLLGASALQGVTATTLSASSTLQVGGASTLQDLTINGNLTVLGTTISASVANLIIEDKAIVIGDGSTSFGVGYGLLFGSGSSEWATFQTAQADIDGVGGNDNILSSSLSIKAPAFAGTLYGSVTPTLTERGDAGYTLVNGINYITGTFSATRTWALPAAPAVGDSVKIKGPSNLSPGGFQLIVSGSGAHKIDDETTAVLESPYAAVECVYVATNKWSIF